MLDVPSTSAGLRRTVLAIALGAAAVLALPGAALADTASPGRAHDDPSQDDATSQHDSAPDHSAPDHSAPDRSAPGADTHYSPANPVDSVFAAPGDLYGTLSAELPD